MFADRPVAGVGRRRPAARLAAARRAPGPGAELRLAHDAADRGRGAGRDRLRPLRARPGGRGVARRAGAPPPRRARAHARRVLLALFVHSLFYSGFFEDPITWLALAIGASFLASRGATGGAARLSGVTVDRRAALGILAVLGSLGAGRRPVARHRPAGLHRRASTRTACSAPLVRAADSRVGARPDPRAGAPRRAARRAAAALVAGLRRGRWPRWALRRARARRRGAPARARDAARRLAARELGAVGVHERLDVPDRARRGAPPRRREPVRARLPRHRARALVRRTCTQPTDQGRAALDHFAYFPGTALTAAAWRLLPAPLDDYRLLVLLATLGLLGAALLFRAPFEARLAAGALLALNPLALRAPWFGTADAPSLLLVVLSFALVTRGRFTWAAATLAGAVLLKQFALVAVPFLALALVLSACRARSSGGPPSRSRACSPPASCPSSSPTPARSVDDTIAYGAGTYRIIGYGLAGLLVEAGLASAGGGLPVRAAGRPRLGAAHRLAAGGACAPPRAVGGRGRRRGLALRPLLAQPRLPDELLALAARLRRPRRPALPRAGAAERSSSAYTRVDPAM